MAFSAFHNCKNEISTEELIDYVETNINVCDDESLFSAAKMLQGLANNKNALIDIFNLNLIKYNSVQSASYSQSSTVMGVGKKQPFVIRANLWPPVEDSSVRTIEEALFSYELPHDHNFSFLTANYFGPGYVTDIWECVSPCSTLGYVGEQVPLEFLERTRLEPGKQMLFRRKQDVHTQHPPEEFSVSLNILVSSNQDRLSDQFEYDIKNQKILGFPAGTMSSKRVFLMELAGKLGNEDTTEILLQIAEKHPCQRTRATALSSAIEISPEVLHCLHPIIKDDRSQFIRDVIGKLL
jgi:hypothetical protein